MSAAACNRSLVLFRMFETTTSAIIVNTGNKEGHVAAAMAPVVAKGSVACAVRPNNPHPQITYIALTYSH